MIDVRAADAQERIMIPLNKDELMFDRRNPWSTKIAPFINYSIFVPDKEDGVPGVVKCDHLSAIDPALIILTRNGGLLM